MSKLLIGNYRRIRSRLLAEDQEQQQIGEPSDAELMGLVIGGDQEAFDLIYLRYRDRLRRFVYGFVRDDVTAEDLLQETFLKVYQNADRFDSSHRFASWLYRIATNLCLNELRRKRMHPHISLNQQVQMGLTDSESETVELHELIPDTSLLGPTEVVESKATFKEIDAALDVMSTVHQQTLSMHLFDEMKYEQIADEMKCSIGTVKSRMFYGLKTLRSILESEENKE